MSNKHKNTVNKLSGLLTGCSMYLIALYMHFFSRELDRSPGYCLEMIRAKPDALYTVLHIPIVCSLSI